MKRGLVVGRFMPLHKGHIALVHFAARQCDALIVLMTYAASDHIPGPLRFEWMKKEFESLKNVRLEMLKNPFDEDSISIMDRVSIWSMLLKERIPAIHVVFSSEEYGFQLAQQLEVPNISFDLERRNVPVSSSMILEHPFRYWQFIATPARGYFVKKICFYGPESTGKSTMAKRLAEIYHTEFVPEVSKELITSNDFTQEDIVRIGHAQTKRVIEESSIAYKFLFCDTDLITTQIYSRYYLKEVPPILFQLEKEVSYDLYFLFDIDVPWVADGLRDLGGRRLEMFHVFKNELEKRNIKYDLLTGSYLEREAQIINKIESIYVNN